MVISYKVTSRVWTPEGKSKPKIKKLQNVGGGGGQKVRYSIAILIYQNILTFNSMAILIYQNILTFNCCTQRQAQFHTDGVSPAPLV